MSFFDKPQNVIAVILAGLGLLQVIITYGAYYVGNRSGSHVSGMPFFGGVSDIN